MAVPEQTPYKEYTANGVAKSFTLGFICDSKNDLIVMVGEIEPPVASWSLVGGNVVFTTAPAAGQKVTLQRNTPFGRTTDYQSFNNSFRPQSVNGDFDRIWLKLQELGVADWLMKLYVDRLHREQKEYIDQKDDELKNYLIEEIRKQGVALDQLEDYYNRLMQKLAEIALEGGWTDSVVATWSGRTQEEENKDFITTTTPANIDSIAKNIDRLTYVKGLGLFRYDGLKWKPETEFAQLLNPKNYGVKGDGVTNDREAFNDFWLMVNNLGGGDIYIPEGTYCIGGVAGSIYDRYMILPRSGNINVYCHPKAVFKRISGYSIIQFYSETDGATTMLPYNGYGDWGKNIHWIGGTFDNNVGEYSIAHGGIYATAVDGVVFENVQHYLGYACHAFDINSSSNFSIINNKFNIVDRDSTDVNKEVVQIAEQRQAGGTLGCKNIYVDRCIFKKAEGSTKGAQRGVGHHNATADIYHENIVITNNVFEDCTDAGINNYKHNGMVIANNKFIRCNIGVYADIAHPTWDASKNEYGVATNTAQAAKDVYIAGNTFDGCGYGIFAKAPNFNVDVTFGQHENWTISGNTFQSCNTPIRLSSVKNFNIGHNTLLGSTSKCFYIQQFDTVIIHDNIIRGAQDFIEIIAQSGGYTDASYFRDLSVRCNYISNLTGLALRTTSGSTGHNWENNTFSNMRPGATSAGNVLEFNNVAAGIISNNVLKSSGTGRVNQFIRINNTCLHVVSKDNSIIDTTTVAQLIHSGSSTCKIYETIAGTPEGSVTAPIGSVIVDSETGIRYRKTTASGATGWLS